MKRDPSLFALILAGTLSIAAFASEPATSIIPAQLISRPAYPVVTDSGFVLLEVWPRVKDITIAAYFLDELDDKSRNLCETTKRALDREQDARAREAAATFSSYRMCMTIKDAESLGWIQANKTTS